MKNPFKGLESYKENNSNSFYGRDDDIARFLSLITNHVFTVLTGKSGLGKTSLLQAGIYPKIRKKNILPIPVRIDLHSDPGHFIMEIHYSLLNQLKIHKTKGFRIFYKLFAFSSCCLFLASSSSSFFFG